MKIGIIIGRIGGVDGVALETEKWIMVLERLGHEVYIVSGEFEHWKMDDKKRFQLPILSFFSPECEKEQKKEIWHKSCDNLELKKPWVLTLAEAVRLL